MSTANGNRHYDVIIIGTGAGGGTLAYRLAPSGKRILLVERGDYVAREKDNWISKASFWTANTKPTTCGATKTATSFIRARTTTSAATPSSMEPRCSASAKRISASF